jgi:hypothetical protein
VLGSEKNFSLYVLCLFRLNLYHDVIQVHFYHDSGHDPETGQNMYYTRGHARAGIMVRTRKTQKWETTQTNRKHWYKYPGDNGDKWETPGGGWRQAQDRSNRSGCDIFTEGPRVPDRHGSTRV